MKNIKPTKEEYRMQPILTAEQREIMPLRLPDRAGACGVGSALFLGGRVSEIVQAQH